MTSIIIKYWENELKLTLTLFTGNNIDNNFSVDSDRPIA